MLSTKHLPLIALLAPLALTLGGCSTILDFSGDCLTTVGCAPLGAKYICQEQECVVDPNYEPEPEPGVLPDKLLTEQCDRLFGAPNEDALRGDEYILIGMLMPQSNEQSLALAAIEKAVALSLAQINEAGINGKKLAVIACDEGVTTPEIAVASARYLIEKLHIKVIIGASSTELSLPVFTELAQPNQILMVSPGSPSPSLANLSDDGLFWRTQTPSDISAAAVAKTLINDDVQKVMVLYNNTSWGGETVKLLRTELCAEDMARCAASRFKGFSFDPSATYNPAKLAEITEVIEDFQPDRVITIAGILDIGQVLGALSKTPYKDSITIEGARSTLGMRVFLGLNPEGETGYSTEEYNERAEMMCRHVGFTSGGQGPEYDAWIFDLRSGDQDVEVTGFTPVFADSIYVVGLAIAAALRTDNPQDTPKPLTGPRIANGMTRLSGGVVVKIGSKGWTDGVAIIQSGPNATVNYQGASGFLNFDERTGDTAGPSEAWLYNIENVSPTTAGTVLTEEREFTSPNPIEPLQDCGCAAEGPLDEDRPAYRKSAWCCGNGVLEDPEQCDDGNTTDGDDCSAICKIE